MSLQPEIEAMHWVLEMDLGARRRFHAWLGAAIETELPDPEVDEGEENEGEEDDGDGMEEHPAVPGFRYPIDIKPIEILHRLVAHLGPSQIGEIRQPFARLRPKAVRHTENYLVKLIEAGRAKYVARDRTYEAIES